MFMRVKKKKNEHVQVLVGRSKTVIIQASKPDRIQKSDRTYWSVGIILIQKKKRKGNARPVGLLSFVLPVKSYVNYYFG